MDLVIQQCSLHALLKETEDTIRPLAIKNRSRLEFEYPVKDFYLTLDKEKLQQILLNLLSNACKFTEDGVITLRCNPQEDKIIWQVSDTGIGIPPDQIEQVFLKFRQVDGSVKRKVGGTGLGLAIAKHFAEMMGGTLSAESRLGKGSTFTLSLPRQHE
jgi:signal transduction histidine kinase